jgi:YhcH/YjgK/YiaL family protein
VIVVTSFDRFHRHLLHLLLALDQLRQCRMRSGDWRGLPDGKVQIDGDAVYALIQTYETIAMPETPRLEAHRRYIDVQFVAEGEEVIGWALTDRLIEIEPYDAEKDVWFGRIVLDDTTPIHLGAGQLAIFYPTDAHLPKRMSRQVGPVKKIVVKVAVDR